MPSVAIPRAKKVSSKHGIELPSEINEVCEIDKKNGNAFWRHVIEEEMRTIGIAFEILEDDEFVPKNYKRVTGHAIFNAKMGFVMKARWELDFHKTPSLEGSRCTGVASKELVKIALTYGA